MYPRYARNWHVQSEDSAFGQIPSSHLSRRPPSEWIFYGYGLRDPQEFVILFLLGARGVQEKSAQTGTATLAYDDCVASAEVHYAHLPSLWDILNRNALILRSASTDASTDVVDGGRGEGVNDPVDNFPVDSDCRSPDQIVRLTRGPAPRSARTRNASTFYLRLHTQSSGSRMQSSPSSI